MRTEIAIVQERLAADGENGGCWEDVWNFVALDSGIAAVLGYSPQLQVQPIQLVRQVHVQYDSDVPVQPWLTPPLPRTHPALAAAVVTSCPSSVAKWSTQVCVIWVR